MRASATPFLDVPVVVLSVSGGFPYFRRFRAYWARLQSELARVAPQGRHVAVDGTGHDIPRDQPDAVANAILEVAARVRLRQTL